MLRKAEEALVSDANKNNLSIKPPTDGVMMGKKFGVEIWPKRRPLCVINRNRGEAVNKRELAEENGSLAANRAVMRRCAAEREVSQQKYNEEAKKAKTGANEFTVWEDIPLTEAEPMALEISEVVASESSQTEEVEMEDVFKETIIDIDCDDCKDPLAVVDYIEDLYTYYKKMESTSCVSSVYMVNQFDINERMRAILIDWLVEVHHKFELQEETLFLTVNLIDRFLANQSVARKKLQLVGLVAMLLACKYEEVSVPVVADLIFISDKAYTRKEVLEMEKLMLSTLQFNMSVPTPYVFMRRFLKAAQSDRKLEKLAFFLIELCLVEYEMLKHPPSLLAAASVYTAQLTLYGVGQWSKTCEWYTSYSEDQLQECSGEIIEFHAKANTGKLTGVHRKYNTLKYGYAARCEPARFHAKCEAKQWSA